MCVCECILWRLSFISSARLRQRLTILSLNSASKHFRTERFTRPSSRCVIVVDEKVKLSLLPHLNRYTRKIPQENIYLRTYIVSFFLLFSYVTQSTLLNNALRQDKAINLWFVCVITKRKKRETEKDHDSFESSFYLWVDSHWLLSWWWWDRRTVFIYWFIALSFHLLICNKQNHTITRCSISSLSSCQSSEMVLFALACRCDACLFIHSLQCENMYVSSGYQHARRRAPAQWLTVRKQARKKNFSPNNKKINEILEDRLNPNKADNMEILVVSSTS